MALSLKIENETSLPDGGPLSVTVTGQRGIDIGRDQYLDWTLPDPTRAISGKHCEIRYRDGAYWLHDLSTNGTFVNGSDRRLQGPHRLRNGDRVEIGHYIIAVTLDGDEPRAARDVGYQPGPPPSGEALWSPVGEVAPPVDVRQIQPARPDPMLARDPLGWIEPPPVVAHRAPVPPPRPAGIDDDWASGPPQPPPFVPPPPPIPSPRRPGFGHQDSPWGTPSVAFQPARRSSGPEHQPSPFADDAPPYGVAPDPYSPEDRAPPDPAFHPAGRPPAAPARLPTPGRTPPGQAATVFQPVEDPAAFPPPTAPFAAPAATPPPAAPFPAPEPAPARSAPSAAATPDGNAEFIRRLAIAAGVPEETLSWQDPGLLADQLGALLRLTAENVKQLLGARAETKRLVRSANQTMIQALDNNPLKFAPTAQDALRIMLGPPSSGYLNAQRAFEQSFKDLKTHQVKTYSAMQHALRLLVEDLAPEAIAESADADRGLAAMLGSRKAKLWDIYVARWNAKTAPHDDGLVDAFMLFFAECYEGRGGR
jgi:type VI secretion system protein ImpI